MFEGSGTQWRKTRQVTLPLWCSDFPPEVSSALQRLDTHSAILKVRMIEQLHNVQSYLGSYVLFVMCLPARREASPGKLGSFEEELFRNADMTDVPVVAALMLGYSEGARTVGIAFADAAGRRMGACEFADDEYFCSTEAVLLQLGAKEVVLPKVPSVGLHHYP